MNHLYKTVINMQSMARVISSEIAARLATCNPKEDDYVRRLKGIETKNQGIKDRLMEIDNELFALYGSPANNPKIE